MRSYRAANETMGMSHVGQGSPSSEEPESQLMAGRPRKQPATPAKSLEQRLWDAADALRGN